MDYTFLIIFIIILVFGFLSIVEDIKNRKVSNKINLSFLLISVIIFIYFVNGLDVLTLLFILLIFGISYFVYKKGVWGAADGKIFIALSLILISTFSINIFFNFVINLFLFYSVSIIVLTQIKTSYVNKKKVLKKVKYDETLFSLLFSFIIISIIYSFVNLKSSPKYIIGILLSVFLLMMILSSFAKKFYVKINKKEKFILNIVLFFIFLFFRNFSFLFYFIFIYLFRILIIYVSELTDKIIHRKNEIYQSPFMVYLFVSALFTFLIQSNIIIILVKFIF